LTKEPEPRPAVTVPVNRAGVECRGEKPRSDALREFWHPTGCGRSTGWRCPLPRPGCRMRARDHCFWLAASWRPPRCTREIVVVMDYYVSAAETRPQQGGAVPGSMSGSYDQ